MRPPNRADGDKAMRKIAAHLHGRDLTLLTQARLLDEPTPEVITLPGFSLFGDVSEWSAPRPNKDLDDILAIYEEYVDRPLGQVRRPDRVARQAVCSRVARDFFGPLRKPWDWWIPVVQLIAIAARISGRQAQVSTTRVTLELEGYRMEAARWGCWSNFRGRMVAAKVKAGDADISLLEVPEMRTSHALARALARVQAPMIILQAANAAIRAEERGDLAPINGVSLHYVKPRGRGKTDRRVGPADLVGAVTACQDIMDRGGEGSLQELYQAAVPALMTTQAFSLGVARRSQNKAATLTEQACERMAGLLESLQRGL